MIFSLLDETVPWVYVTLPMLKELLGCWKGFDEFFDDLGCLAYVCTCVHIRHVCVCIRTCVHVYMCACVYMYVCVYVRMCAILRVHMSSNIALQMMMCSVLNV